jgi:thiamine-phosphate pyrophosphorylase
MFRLMLVTNRTLVPPGALSQAVAQAVLGGVDAVQLREKDLPPDELVALGREVRTAIGGRALLIVNGSIEQARACGADGVQVPERGSMPAGADRNGLLVGRSVHGVAPARRAERAGADYVVLGTVFPSRSHPDGMAGGPALVESVSGAIRKPVIGIGGITAENAAAVLRAGASGVAVISAILGTPDPRAAAARIAAALEPEEIVAIGEQR